MAWTARTWLAVFALVGCGSTHGLTYGPEPGDGGVLGDADLAQPRGAPVVLGADASAPGEPACGPADLMVVLDRTLSMVVRPDGTRPPDTPEGRASSRWALAIAAVRGAVQAPADRATRFGLTLFPRDPRGGLCPTLSQRLAGASARNTLCEAAELVVPLGIGAAGAVARAIDVDRTALCDSTPIANALGAAGDELRASAVNGRSQAVVLITDGANTCSAPPVPVAQALAKEHIRTFVIGLGKLGADGVDLGGLNDLACAGETARDRKATCKSTPAGAVAANRDGPPLFAHVESGDALLAALKTVVGPTCCGCDAGR